MPTINDDAIEFDWVLVQGNDVARAMSISFEVDGTVVRPNISGWTIQGQVRSDTESATLLGTIYGDAAADQTANPGEFTLSMTRSATATFPISCVGDVQFTDDDETTHTYLRFNFTVQRSVTP